MKLKCDRVIAGCVSEDKHSDYLYQCGLLDPDNPIYSEILQPPRGLCPGGASNFPSQSFCK